MARLFTRFLNADARRAQALYILGDLFEHWVGDDVLDDPFNATVSNALRTLTNAGVPVHVMRGNRDFLLGQGFARASGVQLIEDPCVIDLYGQRILLMHGDTLCTDDARYQLFRARVRSPWFQRLFLALPKAARLAVARRARHLSEQDKARKRMQVMDVTETAVTQALRAHDCRLLIHGHTHRPAVHNHRVDGRNCERIVLADWYEQGEYLRFDNQGFARHPVGTENSTLIDA